MDSWKSGLLNKPQSTTRVVASAKEGFFANRASWLAVNVPILPIRAAPGGLGMQHRVGIQCAGRGFGDSRAEGQEANGGETPVAFAAS